MANKNQEAEWFALKVMAVIIVIAFVVIELTTKGYSCH
jgi:uncharacterized membrane protein SirB2